MRIDPDEHICQLVLELAEAFRGAGQVELAQELERVVERGPDAVWAHVRSKEIWGGQGGILDFVPDDAKWRERKRVYRAIAELGEYQNSVGRGGERVAQLVRSARSGQHWWYWTPEEALSILLGVALLLVVGSLVLLATCALR